VRIIINIIIKCSRCKKQVGKNFVFLEEDNLLLHPKCLLHHNRDIRNKDLYNRRKYAIKNAFSAGTGSKK